VKECAERSVKVGFSRNPRKIFDRVEAIAADMSRRGWELRDTCIEDTLGKIHLLFERDVS